jgi:hypothetical protein
MILLGLGYTTNTAKNQSKAARHLPLDQSETIQSIARHGIQFAVAFALSTS